MCHCGARCKFVFWFVKQRSVSGNDILDFLDTAIASQTEPADNDSILNIADGINHAIPTHRELQTSFTWLTKNGLVTKTGAKHSDSLHFLSLHPATPYGQALAVTVWGQAT